MNPFGCLLMIFLVNIKEEVMPPSWCTISFVVYSMVFGIQNRQDNVTCQHQLQDQSVGFSSIKRGKASSTYHRFMLLAACKDSLLIITSINHHNTAGDIQFKSEGVCGGRIMVFGNAKTAIVSDSMSQDYTI